MPTRASAKSEHHSAGYMAKLICSVDVSQEAEEKDESICGPSVICENKGRRQEEEEEEEKHLKDKSQNTFNHNNKL